MVAFQGGHPPFKGDYPYLRPQPSRVESSPTRSKALPAARGLGPTCHASRLRAEEAKPPCAVRTTAQRLQVTLHFCPDQRAKGAGSHAGGMQSRQVGALLRLPTCPAWRPRPTRHATGAPNASCMQLHLHLRHHRASSTAEPVPQLEATQRTTQQRQPGAAVSAAKNGPAVMTVAGEQEQQSRRQLSSHPIRGQRENPLSRREDNAPVFHPRTARACAMAAPPTTRPCSGRRSRRRFAFAIITASKKVRRVVRFRILFLFPLSLSCNRDRERGIPRKGSFPVKEPGSEPPY
jgi:hypothetical protein